MAAQSATCVVKSLESSVSAPCGSPCLELHTRPWESRYRQRCLASATSIPHLHRKAGVHMGVQQALRQAPRHLPAVVEGDESGIVCNQVSLAWLLAER